MATNGIALYGGIDTLPASGAWSFPDDSVVIACGQDTAVGFIVHYEPNDSATSPKVKLSVEWSSDGVVWGPSSASQWGAVSSGTAATTGISASYWEFDPTQDDNLESFSFVVNSGPYGYCRIRAAESGDTANVGKVGIWYVVGGRGNSKTGLPYSLLTLPGTPSRVYGPAAPSTSSATIYTVPSSTRALIKNIHAYNSTSSPAHFSVAINGATSTAGNCLFYQLYVLGLSAYTWDGLDSGIVLAAGDTLRASQETTDAITLTVNAELKT